MYIYIYSGGLTKVRMNFKLNVPKIWSPENPNLYKLVLELNCGDGDGGQYEAARVGIIDVKICKHGDSKIGVFEVNDQRVIIRGVNRHDHHATLGKAVDEASMHEDIQLMKKFNFNAVRTCHYPNHDR